MAIWNEILEGGLNQLLAKRLAMQTGSPTPSISPELGAGLILENDRSEYGYIKGELLAAGRSGASAVVGQFGYVGVTNPANSGILATVERINWQFGASHGFVKARALTLAGAPVTSGVRDTRWMPNVGTARPVCVVSAGTTAAAAPEPVLDYLFPTNYGERTTEYVLRPGTHLLVELEVANIVLPTVTFVWRERMAAPGELGL